MNRINMTKKELEYLKKTIIFPDIKDKETLNVISWWNQLANKIENNIATEEEVFIYNRLLELEVLIRILGENIPSDEEILNNEILLHENQKNILANAIKINNKYQIDDAINLDSYRKKLVTEYKDKIDIPLVQEIIKNALIEYKEEQKSNRIYNIVENSGFKTLNNNFLFDLLITLEKEINNHKNKKIGLDVRYIDTKLIINLIIKYIKKMNNIYDKDNSIKKK